MTYLHGSCYALSPAGLICTLPQGHDGDHAAQDADDQVIETWPQET